MDYRSVFPTLVNLTLLLPPPNLNPLAHTPTRTAFVEHREGSSIVAKVTKRTLDRLAVRRKYAHVFVTSTHRWVSCPVSLFTGEMSNQYPPQPSAPPGACAPPQAAYGQPVSGQPVPTLTPSATVTHVQYPPQPVAGMPVGGQGYNGPTYGYQNSRFPPGQGGQQFRMPDGQVLVVTEDAGSMAHVVCRSYARAVRLFSIVDALICILYVVSGFYYAAIALLGPICGYHGARMYMKPHTLTYVIFCFVNLIWRTAVFITATTVASQVLGFLMVLVEVYITRLAIQFYKILKSFSEEDLRMLRAMEHMPARVVYW